MRIVLLYAPPWKIARYGDPLYPPEEGPPHNFDSAAVTEGDFIQAPYGLLSLAAQAIRSGLSVQTLNISWNYSWRLNAVHILGDLFQTKAFNRNLWGPGYLVRRPAHGGPVLCGNAQGIVD